MAKEFLMLRLLAALFCLLATFPAQATEAGWALLRDGGQAVLMRHAFAPGASNSKGFTLDDCTTQRNLSDRGKQQAEKIGALFAARAASTETHPVESLLPLPGNGADRLR